MANTEVRVRLFVTTVPRCVGLGRVGSGRSGLSVSACLFVSFYFVVLFDLPTFGYLLHFVTGPTQAPSLLLCVLFVCIPSYAAVEPNEVGSSLSPSV